MVAEAAGNEQSKTGQMRLRPVVLLVDDSPGLVSFVRTILDLHYDVLVAHDGAEAMRLAFGAPQPDLILLDVVLPDTDGFDLCARLKAHPHTQGVPVIFLTARSSLQDEERGFALGGVDYITKPISPPILLARVHTHLQLRAASLWLQDQNAYLEAEVRHRTEEILAIQEVTVMVLASLAETCEVDTGNHIRRTQLYVKILAQTMAKMPKYAAVLNEHTIELICKSAPLYDIGKVGIPDRALLQRANLQPEEFDLMKTHNRLGCEAIEYAERKLGCEVPFLRYAKDMAFCHQEKWDGSGYPQGLKGEEIPLCARLMALADAYDGLISRGARRDAVAHEQVVQMIAAQRGGHFAPDVVDAFLSISDSFRAISRAYADEGGRRAVA